MGHNQTLGRRGEDAAARWYESHRYTILVRNWRCAEGEIDIIARKKNTIVFVEVKTRSSDRFGTAFEAVTPRKQRTIRSVAHRWLACLDGWVAELRFDVAAVRPDGSVEVAEGCF